MAVRVHELIGNRVLVTRGSARAIGAHFASAVSEANERIVIDFSGVEALTPAFLDEVLTIIEEQLKEKKNQPLEILICNPPTRLSSKFKALGRSRDLTVEETDEGWLLSRPRPA